MTVDFIVSKYVIDLSGIYGSKTYVYIADENSSTTFTVPLHSELYYQYLSISLYADTLCGQPSTSFRLQKNISLFSGNLIFIQIRIILKYILYIVV